MLSEITQWGYKYMCTRYCYKYWILSVLWAGGQKYLIKYYHCHFKINWLYLLFQLILKIRNHILFVISTIIKSKWIWPGNATITYCRPNHVMKRHNTLTVTWHQKAISSLTFKGRKDAKYCTTKQGPKIIIHKTTGAIINNESTLTERPP